MYRLYFILYGVIIVIVYAVTYFPIFVSTLLLLRNPFLLLLSFFSLSFFLYMLGRNLNTGQSCFVFMCPVVYGELYQVLSLRQSAVLLHFISFGSKCQLVAVKLTYRLLSFS